MIEQVILVNEEDVEIGVMEKQEAHEKALLHRAFSVLIFNQQGEMLLQQRAAEKYHSPGLWTNACCSHPRPGEAIEAAAHRRLHEELGFDCALTYKHKFIYKAAFDNGLTEHELDTIFTGIYNDTPVFNTAEVAACRWVNMDALQQEMQANPEHFTVWFRLILSNYVKLL